MSLYEKIVKKEEKIALVGLGYVGMPIAVAFARKAKVIGYDLNEKKLNCIEAELIQLMRWSTREYKIQR